MKKILFSLLAGATMLLGSCGKESAEDFAPTGGETTFSISVADLQTRATTPITPTRYVMEVYDATGTTAQEVIKNADGVLVSHYEIGSGTFTAHLDKNKAYTCLFWADGSAAGTQSGVYDASSLKTIKLNAGKVATEAYYAKVDVAEGKNPAVSVTLKRAVAKITLVETAAVEVGKQISVTYANNTSFNALDSTAGTPTTDYTSAITTVADKLTGTLGEFYMLTSAGGATLDMSIKYDTEDAKSLTNVPVKQNFNTNIKGEFSNLVSKTFTVTADDTWETPDINKPIKAGIELSATPGANGAPVYEIYTAAGLKAFADLINGAGTAYEVDGIQIPATSTPEARKSNGILKENIDLSEICGAEKGSWVPIGKDIENPYTGTFDGNGKTIKNLYINEKTDWTSETEASWNVYGFFGSTESAVIKNLTVEGSITLDCKGYEQFIYAGGVSGNLDESTVTNCHSSVSINIKLVSDNSGGIYAGGIIGQLSGEAIEQCTSSSHVRAEFNAPASNYSLPCNAGGIVGKSYEADIINCHHDSGMVSAYSVNHDCAAGGIVGHSYSNEVFGCVNNSPVQGKTSLKTAQIGGICANPSSIKMIACYNTGGLTISDGTTEYKVGGISGHNYKSDIIACYSTGNITDNAPAATNSAKGEIVGDFIAYTTPPPFLSQCWFIGTSGNGVGNDSSVNKDGGFVADATALNSKVAGMNTAIKTYNDAAEDGKKCLFHFINGGSKSPDLEAGAPN